MIGEPVGEGWLLRTAAAKPIKANDKLLRGERVELPALQQG